MKTIANLWDLIPFHFRLWSGVGKYEMKWNRKIYEKYIVLGYLDSRDVMKHLDECVTRMNWQREHKEISGSLFCGIGIYHNNKRSWKRDCGTESNTEKEKGESSDSFKRAAVNWGIGRRLYSLPTMVITKQEAQDNRYNLTDFVKRKYNKELTERKNDLFPKKENETK